MNFGDGIVLVAFKAIWCQPCKLMAPAIRTVVAQYALSFVEIDIDEQRDVATTHSVDSVPTLILFKDNVEISRSVGLVSMPVLKQWIEQNLH